jgi:uncharacterized LabA/DUF88 family protein
MTRRVAILMDGGFVTKKLKASLGRFPDVSDIVSLKQRVMSRPRLDAHELFRVYFYDAPPLGTTIRNPLSSVRVDLSVNPVFAHNMRLQQALGTTDDFAVRRGEVVFHGWKVRASAVGSLARAPRPLSEEDLVPDIEQKGVDLRIGLDVASLSVKRIVDVIVLISGDSDLVPAMKFARREGTRVYLDTLGHGVRRELKEHADHVFDSTSDGTQLQLT